MLPVELERAALRRRPEPADDRELLAQPLEALAERGERDRVRLVLGFVPAGAETELDAAAAHRVDLRDGDRKRTGEAERRRRDHRAEADAARVAARPASVVHASVGPGSPETLPIFR